jgi:hypothetical protein
VAPDKVGIPAGNTFEHNDRVLSARMHSLVLKRRNPGGFAVCSSKGNSVG